MGERKQKEGKEGKSTSETHLGLGVHIWIAKQNSTHIFPPLSLYLWTAKGSNACGLLLIPEGKHEAKRKAVIKGFALWKR